LEVLVSVPVSEVPEGLEVPEVTEGLGVAGVPGVTEGLESVPVSVLVPDSEGLEGLTVTEGLESVPVSVLVPVSSLTAVRPSAEVSAEVPAAEPPEVLGSTTAMKLPESSITCKTTSVGSLRMAARPSADGFQLLALPGSESAEGAELCASANSALQSPKSAPADGAAFAESSAAPPASLSLANV
jgi:hypothetical protein